MKQTTIKKEPALQNMAEKKIKVIAGVIIFGLIAAVIYHFFYKGHVQKMTYPYNSFLFLPHDRFNDFFNLVNWCRNSNPYFEPSYIGTSNYLPLANFTFWLFSFISKNLSLILFIGISSAIMYWYAYKNMYQIKSQSLKYRYAIVFAFLTYPYLTCFDRANLELYVSAFLMLFFYFYVNNKKHPAIIFLALAAGMKIYPGIFVLLFLADKKYKEFALTIFYTLILILVPIFLQDGGFEKNMIFILNGFEVETSVPSFFGAFKDEGNNVLQGASLFSAIKLMNIKFSLGMHNLLPMYFVLVALIALFSAFYVVFIEKTLWKKVTILTGLIIILPHISFDYKLLHVMLCIYLFINDPEPVKDTKMVTRMAILLGLLVIPKHYIYFKDIISTVSGYADVPLATVLNPLIFIYLSYLIMRKGFKDYKIAMLKASVKEHFVVIKKSLVYLVPLALIAVPYYLFSKAPKAEYKIYKKHVMDAHENLIKNDKQAALVDLNKAYERKKDRFQLTLQIAGLYSDVGKNDSAVVFYNRTLALYPACDQAQSGILIIQLNKLNQDAMNALNGKNFAEAEKLFNETLATFNKLPPNPANQGFLIGLYTNLSVSQLNLNKREEAKSTFKQILALDPNNEFVKNNQQVLN